MTREGWGFSLRLSLVLILLVLTFLVFTTRNNLNEEFLELARTARQYSRWHPVDGLVENHPVLIRNASGDLLGVYRRLNYPVEEGLETTYWLDMFNHGAIVQLDAHEYTRVANPYIPVEGVEDVQ